MGVRCLPKCAREIVLDLDAMGHWVHGEQEGRPYSTDYGAYCCPPVHAFVGDIPSWAQLRTSDQDAATGVVAALAQIVPAVRQRRRRARRDRIGTTRLIRFPELFNRRRSELRRARPRRR
jgi:hypothetical protein